MQNRNYSSLRHGSGPLAGYARSSTSTLNSRTTSGLADRYLQNASRGVDSTKNNSNSTNSLGPLRTNELKSRFENGITSSTSTATARKSDDINIAPPEEKPRISIGGRYLQRVNSREGSKESTTSTVPGRSSWRESVYGVQYNNKEPTSPTVKTSTGTATMKESDRRRAERERQLQLDKLKQQSLEEEREERRLRLALRKATLEKDEAKIAEVDAEIRRLQLRRQDSKRKEREVVESKTLPRQSSFKTRDKKAEVSLGVKGDLRGSFVDQDIVQTAMSFTDFDEYLKKYLIGENEKKDGPWCTYQPDSDAEDVDGELSIVYKTKRAKTLFYEMPTELQHLVVRAHKRPVRFAAIMELCKTEKYGKEFSAESELKFKGYDNVVSMMTDFGYDMKKVCHRLIKSYALDLF